MEVSESNMYVNGKIPTAQAEYRIVPSCKNDNGFFIELTEGKYHTVKCIAEIL